MVTGWCLSSCAFSQRWVTAHCGVEGESVSWGLDVNLYRFLAVWRRAGCSVSHPAGVGRIKCNNLCSVPPTVCSTVGVPYCARFWIQKSWDPPMGELLVWASQGTPVEADIILNALMMVVWKLEIAVGSSGDTESGGGEPACRAPLAIRCVGCGCGTFCKNKPWKISHASILGHFLKWWQLPFIMHSGFYIFFVHVAQISPHALRASLCNIAPLHFLCVPSGKKIFIEHLLGVDDTAAKWGYRNTASWSFHNPAVFSLQQSSLSAVIRHAFISSWPASLSTGVMLHAPWWQRLFSFVTSSLVARTAPRTWLVSVNIVLLCLLGPRCKKGEPHLWL